MVENYSQTEESDVDVSEFVLTVWTGKWVIFASVALFALAAVYFLVNSQPKYTADAVFSLEEQEPFQISSAYGDAASMLLGTGGDDQAIFDRLDGRDFIIRLANDLDLQKDRYFNPTAHMPHSMSLGGLIKWAGLSSPAQRDVDDVIVSAYRKNVKFSETKGKSVKVSVRHADSAQSARVANAVMAQAIHQIEDEERLSHRRQLNYLSEQLADALDEVQKTKTAVAESSLNAGRISLDILKRHEFIAEANYSALVEQVRMKTLAMGYPGSTARIYQTAAAPQLPSSPNAPLTIAVSLVLGSFVGIGLALLMGRWRGRIHSVSTIGELSRAPTVVRTSALRRFYRPSMTWQADEYNKINHPALLELAAAIMAAEKRAVLVASTGQGIPPLPVALWLASIIAGTERHVTLMVLDTASVNFNKQKFGEKLTGIEVVFPEGQSTGAVLSAMASAKTTARNPALRDVVILVASAKYAPAAARAWSDMDLFTILVTREGRSRRHLTERIVENTATDAVINLD